MCEHFGADANVLEDVSLLKSTKLTLVELYLEEAPFKEFCGDVVMSSAAPSITHTDPICTKPLDSTTISTSLLPTTPLICLHFTLSSFSYLTHSEMHTFTYDKLLRSLTASELQTRALRD